MECLPAEPCTAHMRAPPPSKLLVLILINHARVANPVMQRAFLFIEGNHDVSYVKDHAAQDFREHPSNGKTIANSSSIEPDYPDSASHFAERRSIPANKKY